LNKSYFYILAAAILLSFGYGCSLKKNTWKTRKYQEINTRFNVYFNGEISYKEGLENISKVNKEDYSNIIPMYPISHHSNADAGKSNMDRTIEKCRKAIKLHSIKQKPEKNLKKWKNPDYKLWYNQEEFNPALKYAWILLGKAEFHKGDFLGAAGTFSYIMHHYANDKDAVAQCQLWIVRAYAEMGWIYEAEQKLGIVKQEDLNWKNVGLYASVNADLLLKKRQYKEAIPFLEIALKSEKNKTNKKRFHYLLAQLYQKAGNNAAALATYNKLIKMSPSFEMELNAQINMASLEPNANKVRKSLQKMMKDPKNKDYCDQINYAIGNTYLHSRDTAQAITFYQKSIASSTRNGIDKAVTLITLGDIYYNKRQYIQAQPCYDQAAKIFPTDYVDFERISKRSESLGELVTQYEIVYLQDSLQTLAKLPEAKRMEVIKKVIEKVIADEKAALEAANKQNNNPNGGSNEEFIGPPIGTVNSSGNWYFYNANMMKSGKSDFQKKWGTRKLEDNWRRANKTSSLFAEETTNQTDSDSLSSIAANDSAQTGALSDNKTPEFYIQQLPLTQAKLQKSNDDIADALFNMAMIYKEKVEDMQLSAETFEEYLKRFSNKPMASEACFQLFIINTKLNNTTVSELYRQKLITDYPGSKYVKILSNPDFINQQKKMYIEQDSLYQQSYKAFNENNFDVVKRNADYIEKTYPSSELLPKFLFIKALSIGKTEKKEVFETELEKLINQFPGSDVSSMSKDILALLKQGMENKMGTTQGTLLVKREEAIQKADSVALNNLQFSTDKLTRHRAVFAIDTNVKNMNELLYNVAVYNFTRFIMKDFDLVTGTLDSTLVSLSVTGFDSFDDAEWYLKTIRSDENISKLLTKFSAQSLVVSDENYGIIRSGLGLEAYLKFYKELEQNAVPAGNNVNEKGKTNISIQKNKNKEIKSTP